MRKLLPWLGLGILAAGFGPSLACSSDDGGGGGGKGGSAGGFIDSGTGGGTAATGGTGATGGSSAAGGTGATGGSGGGAPSSNIAKACASDAECGAGLTCVKADSGKFGGGGPAKGYCSTVCTDGGGECQAIDQNSICLQFEDGSESYCVAGCSFGPTGSNTPSASKCWGRADVACSPLFNDTGNPCGAGGTCPQGETCGTTNTCLSVIPACLPQCNGDSDCGAGLFCDPADGTCKTTPKTGKGLGEPCTQDLDASVSECRGNCIGFVNTGEPDPFTYMCAENCTWAVLPSCGWAGPTSGQAADAFCLFASTVIFDNGGPGYGDRGSCGKLCNCNDDCPNPDLICRSFGDAQFEQALQKKGYCAGPKEDDGGLNPGIACTGTGGAGGAGGGAGAAGTGGVAGAAGAAGGN